MKKMISMFAISALLVSMASCTDDNGNGGGNDVDLKPIPLAYSQVQQTEFAQQSNKFANKLMALLSADPEKQGENVCVAPMSMQYVLSMLANGVDDVAAKEIVEALGYDDIESLNQENLAMLNKLGEDDQYVKIGLNNSAWLDKKYTYRSGFKSTMDQYYKANLSVVDIRNNPKAMQQQVDAWAKESTKGLITSFPLSIDNLTEFIVVNANYFDGKWSNPFNAAESKALPFYGLDGKQRNVMTMCNTEEVNHYQDDSLQMVEMPYGQGYYSMMVVMPKKSEYLNDIIEKADWWGWHNQMTKGMANIRLPRFSAEASWKNIMRAMESLGMPSLDWAAIPKVINEYNNTVIDLIAHKVAIHVNENGTKAAGVSAGVGIDGAMTPMPNLSFDHPFIYAVRENTTGAILFMGKVVKL